MTLSKNKAEKIRQSHRQIQAIPDNKVTTLDYIKAKQQHQTIQGQNSRIKPTTGKAAKSDHTKPDIRDKTAESTEPAKQWQNINKISTYRVKKL